MKFNIYSYQGFFNKESSVDLHKEHSSGKNALIIISQGTLKI